MDKKSITFPAFTLIEMIIAMILLVLVAGITSVSYIMLQKQYVFFTKNAEQQFRLELLHNLIYTDIQNGTEIKRTMQQIYIENNASNIRYEITENEIIRFASVQPDTFEFRINEIITLMQNKTVLDGIIDEIHLSVEKENMEPCVFSFTKFYGADLLIKNDEIIHSNVY